MTAASNALTKLPAQAFAHRYPDTVAAGQLLLIRGQWALRVSGEELQGYLLLEGERMGKIFQLTSGMAKCPCIVEPCGWFPAVSQGSKPVSNSEQIATLGISASGPVLIGMYSRHQWEPLYLAVSVAGQATEVQDLHTLPQYERWSVEIFHTDRPFHGLATLLEVERAKTRG